MTLEVPGGTTAQYDRTIAVMGIAEDGGLPPGLIVHTCAVTDDGIVVVDLWDSVSSLDDFGRERLSPALTAGLATATPRISPVHNLVFGTGKEPNVLVLLHASSVTAAEYDALLARIPAYAGGGESHPAVIHVAAIEADGVHTVGLWDSEPRTRSSRRVSSSRRSPTSGTSFSASGPSTAASGHSPAPTADVEEPARPRRYPCPP